MFHTQIQILKFNAMKRLLTIVSVAFIAALCCNTSAKAQARGEMGAGMNFVLATGEDYTNYGLSARYQWTFIDKMRVEPSFTYFFKKDNISSWDLTANIQYLFNFGPMMSIYPLAGFGMTGINRDYAPLGLDKENDTKFAFNFGAGMEFMFSPRMGMNLEYKYRIVDSWNRSHFSFGVIYKF